MFKTLLVSLLAVAALALPTATVSADPVACTSPLVGTNNTDCDLPTTFTPEGLAGLALVNTGTQDRFWVQDGSVVRLYNRVINNGVHTASRVSNTWVTLTDGQFARTGAEGVMLTGWQEVGGNTFFLRDGLMLANQVAAITTNAHTHFYMFDAQGRRLTGIQTVPAGFTVESTTPELANRPLTNTVQFFGTNGRLETGWRNLGGYTYFQPGFGRRTGIFVDGNANVFFANANGIRQTGWINTNGSTVGGNDWIFTNASGVVQGNQWIRHGRSWYFLNAVNCVDVTNPNATVACNHGNAGAATQASGRMARNVTLTNIGGYTGTFRFDNNGRMRTGWIEQNGQWFFTNSNGTVRTGWIRHGQNWYFLANNSIVDVPGSTVTLGQMITADNLGRLAGQSFELQVTNVPDAGRHIFNANGRWLAQAN